MFENISTYIEKSIQERQSHLNLKESCIEIGGNSPDFRGLLAHYLKTTIPIPSKKRIVVLCHACHNAKCSNPNHLYWGTYKENRQDGKENGQLSVWDYTVAKHGLEKAEQIRSEAGRKGGSKKCEGRRLSEQEIQKRKDIIISSEPSKYGWVKRASEELNMSHTSVRRFAKTYLNINVYERNSR